ncbi:MAG: cytochrome ubiquinol oxidase subunit I, partial [Methylomonas sp.]|nr:cytochrome ubiquinol oxidase subunit I [Methylomonas sp.]
VHKTIVGASDKQIALAAQSALPGYPGLIYWAYRLMIACGIGGLLGLIPGLWLVRGSNPLPVCWLKLCVYVAPLPWVAAVSGWCVAEAGKQPWTIAGVLPTFQAVSSQSEMQLGIGIAAYILAYGLLLWLGLFLMRQAVTARS